MKQKIDAHKITCKSMPVTTRERERESWFSVSTRNQNGLGDRDRSFLFCVQQISLKEESTAITWLIRMKYRDSW